MWVTNRGANVTADDGIDTALFAFPLSARGSGTPVHPEM